MCPVCLSGLFQVRQGAIPALNLSHSLILLTYSPPPGPPSLSGAVPTPGHSSHWGAHCCHPVLAQERGTACSLALGWQHVPTASGQLHQSWWMQSWDRPWLSAMLRCVFSLTLLLKKSVYALAGKFCWRLGLSGKWDTHTLCLLEASRPLNTAALRHPPSKGPLNYGGKFKWGLSVNLPLFRTNLAKCQLALLVFLPKTMVHLFNHLFPFFWVSSGLLVACW